METETQEVERPARYLLSRRHYHSLAVKLLAEGRLTQREIGAACGGVSQPTISEFAARHADEIQRVRDIANAQLSALWIADQVSRVTLLQETAEQLIELATKPLPPKYDVKGCPIEGSEDPTDRMTALREIRATLRNVAEELGQLKPKLDTDGQTLRVEIVGVNLEDI